MEHLLLMFLDHTQGRTTVGRTPLDEWSARRNSSFCLWNYVERGGTRDSIVDIATWLGDGRSDVRNPVVERWCAFSPKLPDWLWGSPSHLFSGYRRCILVILTASLLRAPRLRKSGAIPPIPLCVMMVWTGTAFTMKRDRHYIYRVFQDQ